MTTLALVLSVAALAWCAALTYALRTGSAGRHRGAYRDGGER